MPVVEEMRARLDPEIVFGVGDAGEEGGEHHAHHQRTRDGRVCKAGSQHLAADGERSVLLHEHDAE